MSDCVSKKLVSEETFKELFAEFQRFCDTGSEDERDGIKDLIFSGKIIFFKIGLLY